MSCCSSTCRPATSQAKPHRSNVLLAAAVDLPTQCPAAVASLALTEGQVPHQAVTSTLQVPVPASAVKLLFQPRLIWFGFVYVI